MKKLLVLLLFSVSVSAEVIDGDTNNDGVLSGEEQFLRDNPPSTLSREDAQRAVRIRKAEQAAPRFSQPQYSPNDIAGALIESKRHQSESSKVRIQTNCQQIFDRVVCQ